jgi:hypothetical protein
MKPKRNYSAGKRKPKAIDRCQTPAYALDPLLPYLNRESVVWEPAAGEGYLVAALRDAGLEVVSSDIETGENFFDYAPAEPWDVLVTNPPYGSGIKYDWLERCYELGKPFALLVPVEMIGAGTAQRLMNKYGAEILLLDHRVNFKMPNKGWKGTAQFPVLWLCHNILPHWIIYGHIEYRPFPALPSLEAMSCVPRQLALIK